MDAAGLPCLIHGLVLSFGSDARSEHVTAFLATRRSRTTMMRAANLGGLEVPVRWLSFCRSSSTKRQRGNRSGRHFSLEELGHSVEGKPKLEDVHSQGNGCQRHRSSAADANPLGDQSILLLLLCALLDVPYFGRLEGTWPWHDTPCRSGIRRRDRRSRSLHIAGSGTRLSQTAIRHIRGEKQHRCREERRAHDYLHARSSAMQGSSAAFIRSKDAVDAERDA